MVTYVPVPGWLLASRTMQSGISLDQLQKHIHTYMRILLSSCVDAEASCIVAECLAQLSLLSTWPSFVSSRACTEQKGLNRVVPEEDGVEQRNSKCTSY